MPTRRRSCSSSPSRRPSSGAFQAARVPARRTEKIGSGRKRISSEPSNTGTAAPRAPTVTVHSPRRNSSAEAGGGGDDRQAHAGEGCGEDERTGGHEGLRRWTQREEHDAENAARAVNTLLTRPERRATPDT